MKSLRHQLSIIPQNPVLLTGTLRRNVDPFDIHRDDAIWEALEAVRLKNRIRKMNQGLNYEVIFFKIMNLYTNCGLSSATLL